MKIGFIGIGTMGYPMCQNLLAKRVELGICTRSEEKAKSLSLEGAKIFPSEKDLSQWADAIIIMLPDDKAVTETIGKVAHQGKIIINMSTISVECAREFTKKANGWEFVNAPVSGSKKPAEDGQLIILYGGKKEFLSRLEFIFKAMGKAIMEAGSQEDSAKLKLIVNFMMAGMLESLAESMAITKRLGLSQEVLLKTVEEGAMNCGMVRMKSKSIMENNYDPAFATKYILKDLRYLEKEVERSGSSIKSNVVELYDQSDRKYSEKDLSAIYRMFI